MTAASELVALQVSTRFFRWLTMIMFAKLAENPIFLLLNLVSLGTGAISSSTLPIRARAPPPPTLPAAAAAVAVGDGRLVDAGGEVHRRHGRHRLRGGRVVFLPQLVAGDLAKNHPRAVVASPHDGDGARVGGELPGGANGGGGVLDVGVGAADRAEGGDGLHRDGGERAEAIDEEAHDVLPREAAVSVAAQRRRRRPGGRRRRRRRIPPRRPGDLEHGLVEGREWLLVDGASFLDVLANQHSPRSLLHQLHYFYQSSSQKITKI